MSRTVAIGIQNFEMLRANDYFYIDKTSYIKDLWEAGDQVTLIARPRRFGKTLNMDMLRAFFSTEYAGRSDLFEGLDVWKYEKYHQLQGTYPVIFLRFASVKAGTYENAYKLIYGLIEQLYMEQRHIFKDGQLSEEYIRYYERIDARMDEDTMQSSLNFLSMCMSKYYGCKVLIFLDEYDTPLQEAHVGGYWNEMSELIRSLFNATFKTNPYLHRAVMTEITRVSRESIFSDLNNLKVITTSSDQYATAFGFTEPEVFDALEEYGLNDKKDEVKKWYDGFNFGEHRDIYNPWSIINYLDTRKFSAYWANSSGNDLVSELLRKGPPEMKVAMKNLLEGGTISSVIDEQVFFGNIDSSEEAVWSLLLATGYLTAVSIQQMPDGSDIYVLKITNTEVRSMFTKLIRTWFNDQHADYNRFIKALLRNDLESMNGYVNRTTEAVFSYFDTSVKNPEKFYHGFVLGLITDFNLSYTVRSNRECGFGRYDVCLEPTDPGCDAYIFEFKVHDPKKETTLEDTVNAALKQIEEKNYDADLIARDIGPERIKHYGFAFRGKEVLIGGK